MKHFTKEHLETAFVSPATPTFDDLLYALSQDVSLSSTRRRDLRSGLNRLAKVLGKDPKQVPADPRWLQPRLIAIVPKANGISAKSWSNAVSDARAAMAQFGIIKSKNNKLADLNSEWLPLWQDVLATGERGLTAPLSKLFHFLSNAGISPSDVSNDHLLGYRDALALNQIRRDPAAAYLNAFYAWNRLGDKITNWPGSILTRKAMAKRIKLPLNTYPESFRKDLNLLCAKLARPNPFDGDHFHRPMRAASINQYRRVLERFAAVLVHDGMSPSEIASVEVLVKLENAERGLRWMLADYNQELRPALADTARTLKAIAKRHSSLSDADVGKLGSFVQRLSAKKPGGMTAKNRERLRALVGGNTKKTLFCLPDQLFERAGTCKKQTSCLLREQAIAIAILCIFPIRRKNLVDINLDRHIHRPKDGSVFLIFEPDEVKNRQRIECQLPQYLVDMIDKHVKLRAPNFCTVGTPWLFPKRDGTEPMSVDHLAKLVTKRLKNELGLTMNMHLFRHFAAHMMLEAHPGNYEATRRLLGHTRLSTTLNAYTGFENTTASRLFGEIISGERDK